MCEQVKEFECLKETLDLAVMRGRMILLLHDEDMAREYLMSTAVLFSKVLYPPMRVKAPTKQETDLKKTVRESVKCSLKNLGVESVDDVVIPRNEAKDLLKVTLPKRSIPFKFKKEPSPKVELLAVAPTEIEIKAFVAEQVEQGLTAAAIWKALSHHFTNLPVKQEQVIQLVAMNKRRINRQKKENAKPEPDPPEPEKEPEETERPLPPEEVEKRTTITEVQKGVPSGPPTATQAHFTKEDWAAEKAELTQTTAGKAPDVVPMVVISTATRQSPSVLFARAAHESWPYDNIMAPCRDVRNYVVEYLPDDIKTSVEKFFQQERSFT